VASPFWQHLRHGSKSYKEGVYANDEEYFADIIRYYREELHELYEAGCRAYSWHPSARGLSRLQATSRSTSTSVSDNDTRLDAPQPVAGLLG
jgi:methionine synthase II (cobalamin-independent)